ncbi:MAG: 4Fe-4S binding protein [Firmicutes bacterium]|nr:4Fe-4S binding protein [Bacillota bacterium]
MASKIRREIIHIDEEKCDGCGQCVPACAEGALQIIDGKARLVGERLCDGLGACLGDCPRGAISVEVREAEAFDTEAVEEHLRSLQGKATAGETVLPVDCSTVVPEREGESTETGVEAGAHRASELTHWPVQLRLVPPVAKFLQKPHLLVAADCVPFAYADFHRRFLKGKALLIGCPKFDDAAYYFQKLVEIFQNNKPEKITVLMMEVACCSGLSQLVARACSEAGVEVPLEKIVIGIDGDIKSRVLSAAE